MQCHPVYYPLCASHAVINILSNICAVQSRRRGMSWCSFVHSASWICHNMHFAIDIMWLPVGVYS